MRAFKEESVLIPCDEVLGIDEYQNVIEKGLAVLTNIEREAIFLRFWQPYTIAQVADRLRLRWEEADRIIDQAILKIQSVVKEHNARKITTQKGPERFL